MVMMIVFTFVNMCMLIMSTHNTIERMNESLTKPEAFVPNSYRAVQLVMKSGPNVSGIRLNEDDLSVQVRDVSGNPRSYMKENIKELRRDKPSLMPSYDTRLSKQELTDLVAYLNSLKGAQ